MIQYAKRRIDFTFNYGRGQFGDQPGEDVTLTGLRASVNLALAGGASAPTAQFRIFGLTLSMMNELSRVGWRPNQLRTNAILIAAGDEGGAMSSIHQGIVDAAYADLNNAPEVVFEGISNPAVIAAVKPVSARSYIGPTDAAKVMSDLAGDMGVAFENNGVSVILQNPYFPGTAWTQVQACAQAARIEYSLDRGKLAIWNRGASRTTPTGPVRIAVDTGMVGYPTYAGDKISVRTLFNPDIVQGTLVNIDSTLKVASGNWVVAAAYHTLESETPNGAWFTDMTCQKGYNSGQ